MANIPVIWQFLTVVDMDSLASTPGRNAEHHCCYIPDVLLASSYPIWKLSGFLLKNPWNDPCWETDLFLHLWSYKLREVLAILFRVKGSFTRDFFFLIGHCFCVWSIMIGRNGPKEIWGMCQNKANCLAKASLSSRTQIHSETSCLKTLLKIIFDSGEFGDPQHIPIFQTLQY